MLKQLDSSPSSLRTGSPVKFSKAEIASEANANMRAKRAERGLGEGL